MSSSASLNNLGLPIDQSSQQSSDDAADVMSPILFGGSNLSNNNLSNNSTSSLATKAARAELEKRVESLQKQLAAATQSLQRLKKEGHTAAAAAADDDDWDDLMDPHDEGPGGAGGVALPPPSKRGYLFKWLDRSMGWTGTKWALRFVTLEHGRMSYFGSHAETSPRYVVHLRGCAVRDDGWKRNQRHASMRYNPAARGKSVPPPPLTEVGAYFFLFSIYLRGDNDVNEDSEIVPLLRFSTTSLAEKTQWIKLISEQCAYCETEAFLADEAARAAEADRQQKEQLAMTMAMPEAKEGTLPPLYFAPPLQVKKQHSRRPSFTRSPSSKLFRSKSQNMEANKLADDDNRSIKGYPPSKPMHRSAGPSYLSVDAPVQNYRGFFNLGIIVLVVSNFRLMLGTIRKHGFVLTRLANRRLSDLRSFSKDPWEDFPFVSGFLLTVIFILIAYSLEHCLSRKYLNETVGMMLHNINAHTCMAVSLFIVWNFVDKPTVGAALLMHGTITWMKIISYYLANQDYRLTSYRHDRDSHNKATLAMIENLDPQDENMAYPRNVTLGNLLYFWLAPTLTYQIAFPKFPHVRWWEVASILLRMVLVVAMFTFLSVQVVDPALQGLIVDLEATHGTYTAAILAEYWLKLSIPNTYMWLLMFYFYFHLYLNLFAEILRWGDRVFYKDWWNSSEVGAYWRLWNIPVHYWLIRHLYFPLIRLKVSRQTATFLVFLFSAVMHEVLVSVPFHMVRPWSFVGMMTQMPLVALTKYLHRKYPGGAAGNVIFWMSFCVVGQPMAILLYTIDYQYAQHKHASLEFLGDECRVMWGERCLIR